MFKNRSGQILQGQMQDMRQGHGRDVIFLHGWCTSHKEWLEIAKPISTNYRTTCFDARGHGRSLFPRNAQWTVSAMADDLEDLMDHFDMHDVSIVAHSMGAFTLWNYIQTRGVDRLKNICLIDQSPKLVSTQAWPFGIYGRFDGEESQRFVDDLREDFAEAVLRLAALGHNDAMRAAYHENTEQIRRIRAALNRLEPAPLIAIWEDLCRQDYTALLAEITCPTLLVYGAESNYYGEETANEVASRLPNCDLHLWAQADHSPHLFDSKRFVDLLSGFLK